MPCLALCGGAWACSVSGVYGGLNCFPRDLGYFCKRCLMYRCCRRTLSLTAVHGAHSGAGVKPVISPSRPTPQGPAPLGAGTQQGKLRGLHPAPAGQCQCPACLGHHCHHRTGTQRLVCGSRDRTAAARQLHRGHARHSRRRFAAAPAAFVHLAHAWEPLAKSSRAMDPGVSRASPSSRLFWPTQARTLIKKNQTTQQKPTL